MKKNPLAYILLSTLILLLITSCNQQDPKAQIEEVEEKSTSEVETPSEPEKKEEEKRAEKTDEKEEETKTDKEEAEEPLPKNTLITLYFNPSLKGYSELKDVKIVNSHFPDNQKMRLRIEAENVKVYLEEVKYFVSMDKTFPTFEILQIEETKPGEVYEINPYESEGIPAQQLRIISGDLVCIYPLTALGKENQWPVYLIGEKQEIPPLTKDSDFAKYCGILALTASVYETMEQSSDDFYKDPYYYWLALCYTITETDPYNRQGDAEEDYIPIEDWLLKEHQFALLSMVDTPPEPPEALARYVPERHEKWDIRTKYYQSRAERFEVFLVEEVGPKEWDVHVYVEDQEIEALYVLRVVGREPEHGDLFPYSVSWIFEKARHQLQPKG